MSQQLLDDAQVRATLQQVRREGVAQGVRADLAPEAGCRPGALDDRPGLLSREPPAAPGHEERPTPDRLHVVLGEDQAAWAVEPGADGLERDLADRDEPLPVTLADDPDEGAV